MISEAAMEARARRAARSIGHIATKSRWRAGSCDNYGGFMIVDENNIIAAGQRFDMTAEEVIEWCKAD